MKYWEIWFLTFGAGCLVGAVISPSSWFAIPVGMAATWIGWKIHKKGWDK